MPGSCKECCQNVSGLHANPVFWSESCPAMHASSIQGQTSRGILNGLLPRSTPDSPLFLASIMERWLSLRPNADATAHFPSSVGILIEPYAGRQVAASILPLHLTQVSCAGLRRLLPQTLSLLSRPLKRYFEVIALVLVHACASFACYITSQYTSRAAQ